MIWSLTLTWLPRAGAKSKPHNYKQKVQKMGGLPKTWVSTGKQFEDFTRKKEQKQKSPPFKNLQWDSRTPNPIN